MALIYFCDTDKDDLYTLCFLLALKANIKAIVIDDGFLTISQGLKFMSFWLKELKVDIPLYAGVERKNKRNFPSSFVTSFFTQVEKEFDYKESKEDVKGLDLKDLKIEDDIALVTGPITSLAATKYNCFKRIHIMGGNLDVGGNKENGIGEYNLWLDPQAFNQIKDYKGVLSVCPLDCTNYVPLDDKTTQNITLKTSNFLYSYFIRMVKLTTQTINSKLYMWDLVAAVTLFYGGIYKKVKVEAQDEGFFLRKRKGLKVYMFTRIKYKRVINRIIKTFASC